MTVGGGKSSEYLVRTVRKLLISAINQRLIASEEPSGTSKI